MGAFKSERRHRGDVSRLTRREWMIRVVAIMIAASFFGGIFFVMFQQI